MPADRTLQLLHDAIAALERTTGLKARLIETRTRERGLPAILEIRAAKRRYRFAAEVKAAERFETPALIKARGPRRGKGPLLIAPYITREIAERCKELHLPFIDKAGNAYIDAEGLFVYVTGNQRPTDAAPERFRALTTAGLQVTFALLCRPDLLNATYRTVASAAKVALGTVGVVIKDLQARRLIRTGAHGELRFVDGRRMLDEWVARYPTTLRRKLRPRKFRTEADALRTADLTRFHAVLGGEAGADRLTHMLLPTVFTVYAQEDIARIAAAHRLRAAEANANVEILDQFWNFTVENVPAGVAPPQLIYADLMATNDGRNIEIAKLVYEKFIDPAFDRTR